MFNNYLVKLSIKDHKDLKDQTDLEVEIVQMKIQVMVNLLELFLVDSNSVKEKTLRKAFTQKFLVSNEDLPNFEHLVEKSFPIRLINYIA